MCDDCQKKKKTFHQSLNDIEVVIDVDIDMFIITKYTWNSCMRFFK